MLFFTLSAAIVLFFVGLYLSGVGQEEHHKDGYILCTKLKYPLINKAGVFLAALSFLLILAIISLIITQNLSKDNTGEIIFTMLILTTISTVYWRSEKALNEKNRCTKNDIAKSICDIYHKLNDAVTNTQEREEGILCEIKHASKNDTGVRVNTYQKEIKNTLNLLKDLKEEIGRQGDNLIKIKNILNSECDDC